MYLELLDVMEEKLSPKVKDTMFLEIIFMTYSFIHRSINHEAFPEAMELYDKELMRGRGMGKYSYKQDLREEGEAFLLKEIDKRFGKDKILYFS
jgi:spore photoproduct lyase